MERFVAFALTHRSLVVVLAACVAGYGIFAAQQIPVDAFPDVTPTMVQVFTSSPGLGPQEVETLVSVPIERSLAGLPRLGRVQSTSQFGLSVVNAYFDDGTDVFLARQLVSERLSDARADIPSGIGDPMMGPITTGLGGVLMYRLVADPGTAYSLMEQRTLQDWVIKPLLRTVPGVTEVLSVGGFERQYQVTVDRNAIVARGIALCDVSAALGSSNRSVGAAVIERAGEELIVRGNGWIRGGESGLQDIGDTVISTAQGVPVYVRDVASVSFGPALRSGAQVSNGDESVGGDVLKLTGTNTAAMLPLLEAKIRTINSTLPAGLHVDPYYSQASLVREATGTVKKALVEGSVLVLVVLFVFLGNIRSALVVILILPLSVLAAFIGMRWLGLSANLMTLGGLTIAVGMMVDGAVVMVENIERNLSAAHLVAPSFDNQMVRKAAREVANPITFAVMIIVVVFLPLFTLEGIEGKMFAPMAYAVSLAVTASLVFATTLMPVLMSYFARHDATEPKIVRMLTSHYREALDWALARPTLVAFGAAGLFIASLCLFPILGTEFVPVLREGTYYVESALPAGASLASTIDYSSRIQAAVRSFPEVAGAYSRVGRTEVGGDPDPVNVTATTITLRPLAEWPRGASYESVRAAIVQRIEEAVPEVSNNFSQPIQLRTDELITGVKAQVAISVYGDDLNQLANIAGQVATIVERTAGAVDVVSIQQSRRSEVIVAPDRASLARFGMSVDRVLDGLEIGIGGVDLGFVLEGTRRFALNLRLIESQRGDIDTIRALPLHAADGAMVQLREVADVSIGQGPDQITRNNGSRRAVVMMNVRGRDLGGVISEIQAAVTRDVVLPVGYLVEYGGQFENQQRAMKRLAIVVPIALSLILLLLYFAFGKLSRAAMIFMNVPFAVTGGATALWVGGLYLSVPAAVGFIAVFGVAVLNGVVLISCIDQLKADGLATREATREGSARRLRPVLMTALVSMLGLIPLLLADGIGSEVQRPLAAVVVGGLFSSTLLTLFILPSIYNWLETRSRQETA